MARGSILVQASRARGCAGLTALVVATVLATQSAAAQSWPSQPIKMINPLSAGSGPDILSRVIAEGLSRALGRQVVVENRPGAANVLATQAAARAVPDGHTLFFAPSLALAVNPHTFKTLPYDAAKDFVHIAMIGKTAFFLLAHPDMPAQSLPELIAFDKARPDQLTIAVDGPKNSSGMLAAWLNKRAGLGMRLVSYSSNQLGVQDTISGQVRLAMLAGLVAKPLIDQGQLRPLAVSSRQRLLGSEGVPTMAETLPGVEFIGWFVLSAPAGTPVDVVARLNREMDVIMRSPDLVKRLHELGFYTDGAGTPTSTAAFVRGQRDEWATIVREIGLTAE
jgi:tripartite-type tricarboxylate transporter receptor subunit TctC